MVETHLSAILAVFDQFKACDILGHVFEVAPPYLEQKLDERRSFDFPYNTQRQRSEMQGVVCKLPVGKVATGGADMPKK